MTDRSPFTLRAMAATDQSAVLALQAQCYTEIVPEDWAALDAKRCGSPRTCLVAEAAGGPLAYIVAVPVKYPGLPKLNSSVFVPRADADMLYIHDLAVGLAGRGTGAGQQLVAAVLREGAALRLRRAVLVAIQGSAPFWSRFGFAPVEAVPVDLASALGSYGAGACLMDVGLTGTATAGA